MLDSLVILTRAISGGGEGFLNQIFLIWSFAKIIYYLLPYMYIVHLQRHYAPPPSVLYVGFVIIQKLLKYFNSDCNSVKLVVLLNFICNLLSWLYDFSGENIYEICVLIIRYFFQITQGNYWHSSLRFSDY